MGFFDRINEGLSRSREKFREQMNILLDRGPELDEDFWDGLEESLILSDVGGLSSSDIVENLRDQARRKALPDAYAVLDLLYDEVANTFTPAEKDIFDEDEALVLFVGINGTGKTTTVGKIAKAETDAGRLVILGSADTFRAAAIEQLEVWSKRANVEMVTRERGADPASVCYDTIERAEAIGADLVLIDTAGRLHTSNDLMRELEKVVKVVRKRSNYPVYTILVIDATTGQNGLQQAREFNKALDLDGLIVTKLDGTAKGGIALAVSHELELPIFKIGVGESIEDLRPFDAHGFARALLGDFDERQETVEPEAFAEESAGEDAAKEEPESQLFEESQAPEESLLDFEEDGESVFEFEPESNIDLASAELDLCGEGESETQQEKEQESETALDEEQIFDSDSTGDVEEGFEPGSRIGAEQDPEFSSSFEIEQELEPVADIGVEQNFESVTDGVAEQEPGTEVVQDLESGVEHESLIDSKPSSDAAETLEGEAASEAMPEDEEPSKNSTKKKKKNNFFRYWFLDEDQYVDDDNE